MSGTDSHLAVLRGAGRSFAAAALLISAIGLAGWFGDEASWRRLWTSGSEMKFNTAVCLALLGGSLLLAASARRSARMASICGAGAILLITSLTLGEYLLGRNLGIDELVFADPSQLRTVYPGRMAPQSALVFALLGLGVILVRRETPRGFRPAQWLALTTVIFPAQALMGYALGQMSIVGLGPHSSYMAMPTAIAMLCCALAILLHTPDRGVLATLTARTRASSIFRGLLLGALLLPVILGWLALHVAGGAEQPPEYSVATVALLTTLLFVALVWFNAAHMNAADRTLHETEDALRRERERLSLSLAAGYMGVYDLDMVNDVLWWSSEIYAVFGVKPETFTPTRETFSALVHPDDRAEFWRHLEATLALRQPFSHEFRVIRSDGTTRWIANRAQTEYDAGGRAVRHFGVALDITERKEADAAVRESEERFRTLSDNIAQLAWMADEAGAIFWYNQRWFDYTGIAPRQTQGWDWRSVHDPAHAERVLTKFKAAIASGEPWEDTFPLRGADGQYRWFLSRAFPIHDAERKITRWFGTNTDIDAQMRAEAGLRAADKRKDEFLAMLGHELRNPLGAIRHAVTIESESTDDPEAQRWAREVIERQSLQLTRMVDDLLDVARINRGRVELQLEPLDLAAILDRAIAVARPIVEQKKHVLTRDNGPAKMRIEGDPARLEQVFVNLLTNAAKYTPDGGRIHLIVQRQNADAVISLTDSGIGLRADARPHVFDLFTQAHTSLDRAHGGLGIGLTVAKSLVEMHGGSIVAESEGPDRGSTFIVRLPLITRPEAASSDIRDSEPPAEDEIHSIATLRVLIVDDHVDAATTLARLLVRRGCNVQLTHEGQSALSAAREFHPQVVLLDLGLPGLDGYEVCRTLRAEPAFATTRFIAISGYALEIDIERSRAAGFDEHFAKPAELSALIAAMRQAAT